MTQPRRDVALAALAGAHHGVVSREQLGRLGYGESGVARLLRSGRLHRIHRGVYAVGHPVLTREARYLAAVLACGPAAVLSHASAAAVWGLRRSATLRMDVTVPRASGRRSTSAIAVHRASRPVESALVDGIPVTTVARTLADLAEVVSSRGLEKALEQAEALRLLDVAGIDAVAAAQPGRAGPARVRSLVRTHDVSATTRGGLEDAFLELCDRYGLVRPAVNARIAGYEVDFHWPAPRLIVETDHRRHHATGAAFERDRARDQELAALGWRVVRVTDRQLTSDPARLVGLLRSLLSVRSPSPWTPGSR